MVGSMSSYEEFVRGLIDDCIVTVLESGLPPFPYYVSRGVVLKLFPELTADEVESRIAEIEAIVIERLQVYRLIESAYAKVNVE